MIPPHCHALATRCKICHGQLTLWIADISDPRWEAMLVPMATCDKCFDIWSRRQRAGELIQRICVGLNTLKVCGARRDAYEAAKTRNAEALQLACKEYMNAIAAAHDRTWPYGVDEMVGMLMDEPAQFWKVLRAARQQMRTACAEVTI